MSKYNTNEQKSTIKEEEEPLTTDQEYELWKSNVPLLYDFVSETKLVWPSLTVEWLPSNETTNLPSNEQRLLLGTHTSGEEQNYLKIAEITLPDQIINEKTEDNSDKHVKSNIRIIKKFKHELEVTRAHYMPQDSTIIATINGDGTVFIYDTSIDENQSNPIISKLSHHKENGYGLAFNPLDKGKLLSSSDDGSVAYWNIQKSIPLLTLQETSIINDVRWNQFNQNLFGYVTESSCLNLKDVRNNNNDLKIVSNHDIKTPSAFNAMAFSFHSEYLMAASGEDSLIYLYDTRNLNQPLHYMRGHEDSVTSLDFHALNDGIVISGGSDKRVAVWDLKQIGQEQTSDEIEDGDVPELLMIHAGHRSPINDFSMSNNLNWLCASIEEDNIVQVWKMNNSLREDPLVNMNVIR
ncbi:hypothetical protein TBLA_0A07120 [Henningerozyma blattae CBS 6284]|uniref:Histone-binding protein RBBP4-like N-terminal domain-containing protein n=1 Tax=Henningerozyma blattae (strain ATCC 34711 / CBS 6284 / DSM 70876 / NBRC 10599 / NRRL Y-10934 / UCD 77-7) TaxID=1071380 RepID=I2GWK0_HENB6|nr:hypothetical protein TBLA_0A07120 [Tetrapisispora blattae CBS 6284]CCH58502.1 hypothetical protein TBLA_0A07120 [Tetrapisispora blattae CBS 6284]